MINSSSGALQERSWEHASTTEGCGKIGGKVTVMRHASSCFCIFVFQTLQQQAAAAAAFRRPQLAQ